MSKEIQLDDKFVTVALAIAAAFWVVIWPASNYDTLRTTLAAFAILVVTLMVMTVVLIPIAWFLNLRDGEGLGTKGATKEFARRFVLYGFLAAAILTPLVYAQRALHDTPLGWILGLITIYLLVRDSLGAVRLRKARSKLKTIDLSKSRDLTLK